MRKTIMFNGKPLPSKVGVTSLVVSNPDIDIKSIEIPQKVGITRYAKSIGNRSVQMFCALMGDSIRENNAIIRQLYNWCYTSEPAQLILPDMKNSYLLCECDVFPPVDLVKFGTEFQIGFKASYPGFIDIAESSANVGQPFIVGGNLPVFPRITQFVNSPIDNPTWTIDGNKTITLNRRVNPGSGIYILCDLDNVIIDITNVNSNIDINSTVSFTLEPGEHIVQGSNGAGGFITWRNASLWGA